MDFTESFIPYKPTAKEEKIDLLEKERIRLSEAIWEAIRPNARDWDPESGIFFKFVKYHYRMDTVTKGIKEMQSLLPDLLDIAEEIDMLDNLPDEEYLELSVSDSLNPSPIRKYPVPTDAKSL